jgi:hypothetical protein
MLTLVDNSSVPIAVSRKGQDQPFTSFTEIE